jgi:hypothetical protein
VESLGQAKDATKSFVDGTKLSLILFFFPIISKLSLMLVSSFFFHLRLLVTLSPLSLSSTHIFEFVYTAPLHPTFVRLLCPRGTSFFSKKKKSKFSKSPSQQILPPNAYCQRRPENSLPPPSSSPPLTAVPSVPPSLSLSLSCFSLGNRF